MTTVCIADRGTRVPKAIAIPHDDGEVEQLLVQRMGAFEATLGEYGCDLCDRSGVQGRQRLAKGQPSHGMGLLCGLDPQDRRSGLGHVLCGLSKGAKSLVACVADVPGLRRLCDQGLNVYRDDFGGYDVLEALAKPRLNGPKTERIRAARRPLWSFVRRAVRSRGFSASRSARHGASR